MSFDPFALTAIIIFILLFPFTLFILMHTARRSGQEEWDRAAERGLHQRLPKRVYTQRYIDALDGEPGPRRPQVQMSRNKTRTNRPSTPRKVIAVGESAVMSAVDDRDQEERERFSSVNVRVPPSEVYDRFGQPNSHMQAHTGGDHVRINEIWFDRV